MKSIGKKSTVELVKLECRISTRTMQRELKGLGLKICVASRKSLISEANLKFAQECEDWALKKRSCGLMSPDVLCSRVMDGS